jgi:hypothetical protein
MEQAPRHAFYAAALTARFSSRKKSGLFTNAPAAVSVFWIRGPARRNWDGSTRKSTLTAITPKSRIFMLKVSQNPIPGCRLTGRKAF